MAEERAYLPCCGGVVGHRENCDRMPPDAPDGHSGFSAEEVEKAARAVVAVSDRASVVSEEDRAVARAVLSASGTVPRAEHEELWAENQRLASDHYFARAESAEARCKSYEARASEVAKEMRQHGAVSARQLNVWADKLEGSVPADQEPT